MEKKDLPEEEKPVTPEQEPKQAPQEEKRTFGARVRAFAGMCAERTSAAAKKCAAFVKKTFSKEQSVSAEEELNKTEETQAAKQAAVQADAQADKVSVQAKGAQVHAAKEAAVQAAAQGDKISAQAEGAQAQAANRAAAQSVVQADMQGTENSAQSETFEIDEESEIEAATTRTLSPARLVLKRFFRSKLSVTGLVILITLFVFSFLGPVFSFLPFVWPEQEADYSSAVREEYTTEITVTDENGEESTVYVVTFSEPTNYLKPSWRHWLGTDAQGYDVFSRLMYGGRISLTVGFVVVILETVLGVLLGGLAGYFGKWVDQLIMRIVDIFNCVPTMPMLMIVGVALEANKIDGIAKLYIMMAMLTLFGWAGTARLVRGQILSLREQEFMISAEASGLPVWRKIFKHLIPNVMPQLIVSMTLGLGGIILTEATLGYLGIGLPIVYATWGNMINAAANNTALTLYPNLWISPGICIVLAVLAFNFVGDGLRDAFDPKARR